VLAPSGLLYPGALLAHSTRLHSCHAVPGVRTGVAPGSTEHLLFYAVAKRFRTAGRLVSRLAWIALGYTFVAQRSEIPAAVLLRRAEKLIYFL